MNWIFERLTEVSESIKPTSVLMFDRFCEGCRAERPCFVKDRSEGKIRDEVLRHQLAHNCRDKLLLVGDTAKVGAIPNGVACARVSKRSLAIKLLAACLDVKV